MNAKCRANLTFPLGMFAHAFDWLDFFFSFWDKCIEGRGYGSATIATKGSCTLEANSGIGQQEVGDAVAVINDKSYNNNNNSGFVTFPGILGLWNEIIVNEAKQKWQGNLLNATRVSHHCLQFCAHICPLSLSRENLQIKWSHWTGPGSLSIQKKKKTFCSPGASGYILYLVRTWSVLVCSFNAQRQKCFVVSKMLSQPCVSKMLKNPKETRLDNRIFSFERLLRLVRFYFALKMQLNHTDKFAWLRVFHTLFVSFIRQIQLGCLWVNKSENVASSAHPITSGISYTLPPKDPLFSHYLPLFFLFHWVRLCMCPLHTFHIHLE